jgi:hypothetical protein
MEKNEKYLQNLKRKLEEKRTIGGHRRRWEPHIKVNLKGTGYEFDAWIQWTKEGVQMSTLVSTVMNIRKYLSSLAK